MGYYYFSFEFTHMILDGHDRDHLLSDDWWVSPGRCGGLSSSQSGLKREKKKCLFLKKKKKSIIKKENKKKEDSFTGSLKALFSEKKIFSQELLPPFRRPVALKQRMATEENRMLILVSGLNKKFTYMYIKKKNRKKKNIPKLKIVYFLSKKKSWISVCFFFFLENYCLSFIFLR